MSEKSMHQIARETFESAQEAAWDVAAHAVVDETIDRLAAQLDARRSVAIQSSLRAVNVREKELFEHEARVIHSIVEWLRKGGIL